MNNLAVEGVALHVQNVERSIEFYTKLPGARLLVHIEGTFALIQIGRGRINLVEYGTDLAFKEQRFHIEVETPDVNATYRDVCEVGLKPLYPPTLKPWGETDFRVADPDGYWLEFSEPNPALAKVKRRLGLEA
jgi:catechol 2,3-dioxygenase-like lactoylglutathione lyase family enzyme